MSGTVNISRSIWNSPTFNCEPFTEREAWMWLIMEASWKARTKRIEITSSPPSEANAPAQCVSWLKHGNGLLLELIVF